MIVFSIYFHCSYLIAHFLVYTAILHTSTDPGRSPAYFILTRSPAVLIHEDFRGCIMGKTNAFHVLLLFSSVLFFFECIAETKNCQLVGMGWPAVKKPCYSMLCLWRFLILGWDFEDHTSYSAGPPLGYVCHTSYFDEPPLSIYVWNFF